MNEEKNVYENQDDVQSSSDSESESNSSLSSSSSSELNQINFKERLQSLRQRIQSDSGDFQAWLELIRLLRQNGELEDLREVRKQFSDRFPLPFGW
jgi:hypothetical protein